MTAQDTFLPDTEKKYRAVWISDIHLGTPGCQAGHLLDFLRSFDSDYLYLVGDIIDGWQLKRSWYWQQSHNDVILIQIMEEAIRETADGRRLWITHGDLFDGVIQCARWLAHLGDQAYEFTLKFNRWFNYLRARLGLPYWSLSRFLKHKVKRAVSFISDFEQAVAHEARRRGLDGVVCGHIHHAEMREIEGVLYCNDGDWVESLTALVEHEDGRLEIIDWSQHIRQRRAHTATAAATAAAPVPLPLPEPVTAESQS